MPDQIFGAFRYDGRIKEVIHQYKYEDAFALSYDLAQAITPLVRRINDYKTYSTAFIPLSKAKLRSRGYNQAGLLAEEVGKSLGLRVVDLMDRSIQEETQVISKTKKARKQNIKGVFNIKNNIKIPKNLILIDDVVTTGATVEEASKVLRRAGAKSVVVIALAMA